MASLDGLSTPGGFTVTEFHQPPDGDKRFYSQTGLSAWVSDRFWKTDSDFYDDATPKADDQTLKAVNQVGNPLYGKDPDPSRRSSRHARYTPVLVGRGMAPARLGRRHR
ncbi:hypothetical protein ACFVU0_13735 [Streptomyces sp. NPDC058122]|uniref:hypothetical protein n=1 Tax=Streptomyces sp. NPDC058122 TaxID=3346349 RepID=UPI0036E1E87D